MACPGSVHCGRRRMVSRSADIPGDTGPSRTNGRDVFVNQTGCVDYTPSPTSAGLFSSKGQQWLQNPASLNIREVRNRVWDFPASSTLGPLFCPQNRCGLLTFFFLLLQPSTRTNLFFSWPSYPHIYPLNDF